MIDKVLIINNATDFATALNTLGLTFKSCWNRYVWLPKTDYYRLVLFDNGEYGLFTQSQLPIVKAHQDLNSPNWKDYKPYADKGYKEMRSCGVEAGTKTDNSWTNIRKSEFRKSEKWLNFTKDIKEKAATSNGTVRCQDCGLAFNPYEIEVHHLFPERYDELDRDKFKLLCHECHQVYTRKGL